jgi:hypothetical protein
VDTGSDLVDPKPITQKHLRIYKAGDEIRYNVQFDIFKGTLVTKWELPIGNEIVDANPLQAGNQIIPGLLKETTTFEHEGSSEQVTVVRYITQDADDPSSPTYGSITVHAFDSPAGPEQHHYVHDSSNLALPGPPTPAIVLPSPLPLDNSYDPIAGQNDLTIDFYVLPCNSDTNSCQGANQRLTETLTLSQMIKENLESTLDFFQSIKVPFDGNITDQAGSAVSSVRLDIRAFCGDVNDDSINYSGSEWFYPSIGIVRYEAQCTSSSGDSKFFAATVSSVNFSY